MTDDKIIAAAAEAIRRAGDTRNISNRLVAESGRQAVAVVAAVEPLIRAKIAEAIQAETEPLADIDGPVPMGRRIGMLDAARIAKEGSR